MTANFGASSFTYTVPTGFSGVTTPYSITTNDVLQQQTLPAASMSQTQGFSVSDVVQADVLGSAEFIFLLSLDSIAQNQSITIPSMSIPGLSVQTMTSTGLNPTFASASTGGNFFKGTAENAACEERWQQLSYAYISSTDYRADSL
jgi:hypothetical protein